PGSSETLYFEAPTEAGVYRYVCTFPGHAMVMRGTLIVEK
ncbi:MAG: plastocyanin/azurin family copper-binding protein, partial [Bacteroidota bacterium]